MNHSMNSYKCLQETDKRVSLSAVLSLVMGERERQHLMFPEQWENGQSDDEHLSKVTEEYLEVVRGVNDKEPSAEMLEEIIQTAALLCGWAQFKLHQKLKEEIEGV